MELFVNDRIRNRKVRFFNEFSLSLRFDTIASGFAFSQYFNPDNIEHKEMLCIGHDHIATVTHNKQLLLTGYVMSQKFNHTASRKLCSATGYSKPGFLEDCQIATDSYPLQMDGLSLREISAQLIKPFGLRMIVGDSVSGAMDEPYDKATAEVTESIKEFICKLAVQKNIIVTHNIYGDVVFTRANTKRQPIANYDLENGIPFTEMSLEFNGQGMHSKIEVIKEADKDGGNAGQSEILNPYVPFVYRSKVITQTAGTDIDTDKAARSALATELQNLKLIIVTDRWEIDGKVIMPNNIIKVRNPECYLYKTSRWFIEEVALKGDQESTTATITCCLPEVYNDDPVEYLFKGINLH